MKKQMIIIFMLLSVCLTACKPSIRSNPTEHNDSALLDADLTFETQSGTENNFDDFKEATEIIFDPTELVLQKKVAVGYRTESQYAGRFTEEYRLYLEQITGYEVQFMPFEGSVQDALSGLRRLLNMGDSTYIPDILVGFPLYGLSYLDPVFMDLTDYFDDPEKSAVFWRVFESSTTEVERTLILEHMNKYDKISIFPANVFSPHPNDVWNLGVRCLCCRSDERAIWDFLMVVLEDAVTEYDP